jgi:hypothetical protein
MILLSCQRSSFFLNRGHQIRGPIDDVRLFQHVGRTGKLLGAVPVCARSALAGPDHQPRQVVRSDDDYKHYDSACSAERKIELC